MRRKQGDSLPVRAIACVPNVAKLAGVRSATLDNPRSASR